MTTKQQHKILLKECKENIRQSREVLRNIYKEKNNTRGQCNKVNKYKCKEHIERTVIID